MLLVKFSAGVLVAGGFLLAPVKSFAEPFEERLLSSLEIRNKATYLTTNYFTDKLNQRLGKTIPADALDDNDYKLLAIEVVGLSKRIEELGDNVGRVIDDPEWKKRLEILLSTTLAISDPMKTGQCARLGIDLESARDSRGDWRQVKVGSDKRLTQQEPGSEIKPSSHLHTKLYWYYRLGCGGNKDLETARRVLFDISDMQPADPSKRSELRPELRHCEAEIWTRYGIGGPVDLVQSEQFSKRYTKAAFFFRDEETPERRAELATRYPDAARRNFGCPRPEYYLDPRNPWRRLW